MEGKKKLREVYETNTDKEPTLAKDVLHLFIKIIGIFVILLLIFTFLFGIFRYGDISMEPGVKDGDLVLFYRLDKNYVPSDCLVLEYQGKRQVRRVAAVAGDVVDITQDGLVVNGALRQEEQIYQDTYQYTEGIDFPVTVEEGQVFVLGDNRKRATDSRIYGAVEIEDTLGKVMTIIRRRGI